MFAVFSRTFKWIIIMIIYKKNTDTCLCHVIKWYKYSNDIMKQTFIYLNGQQSKNFKTINKHSNENKNLKTHMIY